MTFVDYPAIAGLASHLRGDPLTVLEPATGERLADVPSASPADVDAAARAASAAQAEWAAMTFDQRAAVLRRAAERLRSCLLYTSPSPRDATLYRMPSSA